MYKSRGSLNKNEMQELGEVKVALKASEKASNHKLPPKKEKNRRHQLHVLLVVCSIILVIGSVAGASFTGNFEAGSIAVDDLTSLEVTLNINSHPKVVNTNATSVGELLREQHIQLTELDYIPVELSQPLYDGMVIWLRMAVDISIKADGKIYDISSQPITVKEALDKTGITLDADDQVSLPLLSYIYESGEIEVYRVETKEEVVDEPIECPEEIIEFAYLTPGSKTVVDPGREGISRNVYNVTYKDGTEVSRKLLSSAIYREPTTTIVGVGPSVNPIAAATDENGNLINYVATASDGSSFYYTESFTVQATAYTWTGNQTATGTWPAEGRTIAVDPSVIPLGTKVYVVGYGFATAEDTGGAIKGNIIDLYMDSESDCYAWGRRNVTIYILTQ